MLNHSQHNRLVSSDWAIQQGPNTVITRPVRDKDSDTDSKYNISKKILFLFIFIYGNVISEAKLNGV